MKRGLMAVAAVAALLVAPAAALAHPLGNFTVNHYARIEPRLDGLRIDYVLDEAEIPTFQDKPQIDADADAFADARTQAIGSNLHVNIDGEPVALRVDSRSMSLAEGAGGLPTLRLEATYSASFVRADHPVQLAVRDDNDPTRIGWREIVASPADDSAALQQSSVPSADVTDGLRAYPDDLLSSPLNVRSAELTLAPASVATSPRAPAPDATSALAPAPGAFFAALPSIVRVPDGAGAGAVERARAAFADLANADELTPAFIVFAVGVALVLGAAHALQPGHGKTVVAAYLVGARGTPRHALFLGVTVTATHTAGVYALGLVTLALSQYIVPERLYPLLEVGSGVLVLLIGAWLFGQRLPTAVRLGRGQGHHLHHGHDHTHSVAEHSHEHSHAEVTRVGWRSLLALGISGGLLPCPEALMVLLITIAAHRVLFGLLLIVSFSTGLAAVLVGFGLLLVYARNTFQHLNLSSNSLVPRLLPVASAFVIVVAGCLITAQALPQVL